jgi:hypothetical protein
VEAGVIQVPLRYHRFGDEGNELKLAPARTGEDVHGEDLLEEVGPRRGGTKVARRASRSSGVSTRKSEPPRGRFIR